MGLVYHLDPVLRLVKVRPDHLPTLTELQELAELLLRDGLFTPAFSVLVDRRDLSVEPDAAFVRGALDLFAEPRFRGIRWATLTSHLTTYGMGRMAESFAELNGVQYRVFMDETEAVNWLLEHTAAPAVSRQ